MQNLITKVCLLNCGYTLENNEPLDKMRTTKSVKLTSFLTLFKYVLCISMSVYYPLEPFYVDPKLTSFGIQEGQRNSLQ